MFFSNKYSNVNNFCHIFLIKSKIILFNLNNFHLRVVLIKSNIKYLMVLIHFVLMFYYSNLKYAKQKLIFLFLYFEIESNIMNLMDFISIFFFFYETKLFSYFDIPR